MRNFAEQIFYGLVVELISLLIAYMVKERKLVAILVFAIGTVVAGVIAFIPTTTEPPLSTPTKTATFTNVTSPPSISTSATANDSKVLVTEDFEDEKAQSVSSTWYGWKIISDETGNKVYAIDNSKGSDFPRIYFNSEQWKDFEIKYRMRFVSGTSAETIIEFRCQDETCRDKYAISIDLNRINLGYSVNSYDWKMLKSEVYPLKKNTWYWIRIQAQGQDLRVYVDDVRVINTDDNHYASGAVNIQAVPYTYMQIDDIQVISLEK